MHVFTKLHFIAALGSILVVNFTMAAPLSSDSLEVMERSEGVSSDVYAIDGIDAADLENLEMEEDLSISELAHKGKEKAKSVAKKVESGAKKAKSGVKKVATVAKPFIDTAADIAQFTPFAPEAAIIHTIVEYVVFGRVEYADIMEWKSVELN
ncbi:hypothetical protein JR316_0011913 [Psilocybe cubensis]|uniref:Uncharacterized protein n=2 Tax=Psilocybe cubensis TaxID=181762 RepID=A0A8H8CER9_PSICU|nr:hypothetical protein JR316_0011913 [Psilocybe cubensis]KAH9476338.1 hypothetical protein JR316_0011913 [Psilocybe cubensis]